LFTGQEDDAPMTTHAHIPTLADADRFRLTPFDMVMLNDLDRFHLAWTWDWTYKSANGR
jgi:hypothetical protein